MSAGAGVAFQTLQVSAHLCGALIAQVAVLFHGFLDDLLELRGNGGIQTNCCSRIFVKDFVEDRAGALAFERKESGGHLVEYDTEGKEIGARIELLAEDLFGRHVRNGTESAARAG